MSLLDHMLEMYLSEEIPISPTIEGHSLLKGQGPSNLSLLYFPLLSSHFLPVNYKLIQLQPS